MIISKLLKSASYKNIGHLHTLINHESLYNLVNTFITKTQNIQIWIKDIIREESGAVVQEIAV